MRWKLPEHLGKTIKQYRMVLLVLVCGICLMAMPASGSSESREISSHTLPQEELFDLEEFEQRVADILSEIEGAGRVQVAFTLKSGSRRVLAQDVHQDGQEMITTTVLVGRLSSAQESVIVQTLGPVFQGAVVVCTGGEDPNIRLALSQAVSVLTGLGSDRISVCKGT